MPYKRVSYDNFSAALDAALTRVQELPADSSVPVIVVSSHSMAMRVRVTCAQRECAFGVRVETFASWLRDHWELYGDGRVVVDSYLRKLLVAKALREVEERATNENEATDAAEKGSVGGSVYCAPGLIDLLADLAAEALPQVIERAGVADEALTDAQRRLVAALVRYADLLADRSLCELSQVARELSQLDKLPVLLIVGVDYLPVAFDELLERAAARGVVERFDDARRSAPAGERSTELSAVLARLFKAGDAVVATGDVRIVLPAGRYAQPKAVLHEVKRLLANGCPISDLGADVSQSGMVLPVAVSSKHPLRLYDSIAGALARKGRVVAVHGRRAFCDTSLGRALLALFSVAFPDSRVTAADCGAAAADFALSAFSGIPRAYATSLDAAWRADRLLSRDRLLGDLTHAGDTCAKMLQHCTNRDFSALIDAFEHSVMTGGAVFDDAWRAEQFAAASQARRVLDAASAVGESFPDAMFLLANTSVSVRVQSKEDAPEVVVMSFGELASMEPCSCNSVIICDMTSADYPVRSVDTPKTLLFETLGIAADRDELSRMRRQLVGVLSAAKNAVVLCRVMNTVDAAEAYPAVAFDEVVDCYRGPHDNDACVDRTTGLPQCLAEFACMQGEDELTACLAVGLSRKDTKTLPEEAPADRATEWGRRFVALPRAIDSCEPLSAPLSASALESYLECPHKWFAQRRLRLGAPDAGFGPLEMGSFAHSVLRSFYVAFQEEGFSKVGEENASRAAELLDASFNVHLAKQPALRSSQNPLIPTNSYERDEVERLRTHLHDYLGRESQLLPGFSPRFFELPFGDEVPFDYAGFLLRGSIDRIDVNDRGQAVIIDYKGSVGPDYALSSASPLTFDTPCEVSALSDPRDPSTPPVAYDSCGEDAGDQASVSTCLPACPPSLPHKIQTLVYAQVVKRLLGFEPVGALYVSYGTKPIVSGSVDRTVLGPADLPDIRFDDCSVPGEAAEELGVETFAELVQAVEDRIRVVADKLYAGFIEPNPRGPRACNHCPVLSCTKRSGHES